VTTLATFPQAPGARPQAGEETVANLVRVTVDRDSVHFHLNGERVAALGKAGLETDGRFGFRIGRDLNLHITNLDLTQRLAPPRR
jgi:hypothetical protein